MLLSRTLLYLCCVIFWWGFQPVNADTTEVALIHWNDFHAYNQFKVTSDGDTVGGYAYLTSYRDSLAALHPGAAFSFHAGDDFQGTPISTFTKGASQIRLLNLVRPDAFVLGNHEFDYGRENLDSLVQTAHFPVLSANIRDTRTDTLFARPYTILDGRNVTIGVVGVTTPELYGLTLPANVRDLEILSPVEAVRQYADSLDSRVDLTVVLSHMGLRHDSLLAASLGEESPVDIIIGGHSHTRLSAPITVNDIPIVQAGNHGQYLGYARTSVDTKLNQIIGLQYQLIPVRRDGTTPVSQVQTLVDSLEAEAKDALNQTIALLAIAWERQRKAESNIGNWQADVMRTYADADIAFQNSGGIRKDLAAGPITVRDIWEINPFGNHFVRFTVTGHQLKTVMYHQISNPKEFLQLSGIVYTWDRSREKFTRLGVDGKKIRNSKEYTIATNNYVFSHFRDFFGIERADITKIKHFPDLDRDVFLRAAANQDTIHSTIEHRAKIIK